MLSLPLLPPFISAFGGLFGGEPVSEKLGWEGEGVEGGLEGGGVYHFMCVTVQGP